MSDLRGTLDRLVAASLLRKVLTEADPAYKFRHTLDQQTAYHSLLRKDRELIHKVVGLSIERDTTADMGTLAPVLAEHFSVAGDDHRALKYYMMAGDEATTSTRTPKPSRTIRRLWQPLKKRRWRVRSCESCTFAEGGPWS